MTVNENDLFTENDCRDLKKVKTNYIFTFLTKLIFSLQNFNCFIQNKTIKIKIDHHERGHNVYMHI